MPRDENWGKEYNLEISWSKTEQLCDEQGSWTVSHALVWLRKPIGLAASVFINHDKQYAIHTQGLYGLSDTEREALERHLESKGFTKRKLYRE